MYKNSVEFDNNKQDVLFDNCHVISVVKELYYTQYTDW